VYLAFILDARSQGGWLVDGYPSQGGTPRGCFADWLS
jgi:hypothetical protein